jgi:hypothetical protein
MLASRDLTVFGEMEVDVGRGAEANNDMPSLVL